MANPEQNEADMHIVTETTHAANAHVLRMTERQAQALAGLLLHADFNQGEGSELEDIYAVLVAGGAEVDEVYSDVAGDLVVVSRQ